MDETLCGQWQALGAHRRPRDIPAQAFELVTLIGGAAPHPRGAAYRARNWESAATQLGYALNAVAGDQPSQLLRARALNFMQNPPPADWDAVWNLLDK